RPLSSAKRTYPRPPGCPYHLPALLIEGVVDRGVRRRSGVRPPTTRAALERREAQGSSQGPARHGTPTPLKTWVPEAWRDTPASQAGEGSLASSLEPPGAPHSPATGV